MRVALQRCEVAAVARATASALEHSSKRQNQEKPELCRNGRNTHRHTFLAHPVSEQGIPI
jgi:hypothetical protein